MNSAVAFVITYIKQTLKGHWKITSAVKMTTVILLSPLSGKLNSLSVSLYKYRCTFYKEQWRHEIKITLNKYFFEGDVGKQSSLCSRRMAFQKDDIVEK